MTIKDKFEEMKEHHEGRKEYRHELREERKLEHELKHDVKEGIKEAEKLGYPVLVRPSYVLGGQGMEITYNEAKLKAYLDSAFERDSKSSIDR